MNFLKQHYLKEIHSVSWNQLLQDKGFQGISVSSVSSTYSLLRSAVNRYVLHLSIIACLRKLWLLSWQFQNSNLDHRYEAGRRWNNVNRSRAMGDRNEFSTEGREANSIQSVVGRGICDICEAEGKIGGDVTVFALRISDLKQSRLMTGHEFIVSALCTFLCKSIACIFLRLLPTPKA